MLILSYTSLPHSSNDPDGMGQNTVVQYSARKRPELCFNEADDFVRDTLAPEGSSHIFVIETVESFFVINEYQVERLLEPIDLLQDWTERHDMVYTGSFRNGSLLAAIEELRQSSPVFSFAENFKKYAQ